MTRLKFVLSVAIVSLLVNVSMAVGGAWIGSGDIIDGAVHENDIGKMAVTKTKIKTGAVNKYKIASGAVNKYKIQDGAVTPAKLSQSYASTSHNHDSRYYTVDEVDWLLDDLAWWVLVNFELTPLSVRSDQELSKADLARLEDLRARFEATVKK